MTDWIHCNKCFLRFNPQCKFYVSTCGHLHCQNCVNKIGPGRRCLCCNSVCDLAELSNNLKPEMQCFFRPVEESARKVKQIFRFQHENTISILKNVSTKYGIGKSELMKLYKIVQELEKQNAKLKAMLMSKRQGASTSTPMHYSSPPFRGQPGNFMKNSMGHHQGTPWSHPNNFPRFQGSNERIPRYPSGLHPSYRRHFSSDSHRQRNYPGGNPTLMSMNKLGIQK